jgi:VanZ family protein
MRFLRQWLPVILWAALILSASTDTFSSAQSSGWAVRFLGLELPEIVHIILRKSGHIFAYSVLAYLGWRAHHTTMVPLLIALAVSSTDEFLQSRTAMRTGTPWDVVLDTCAAAIVVLGVRWQSHRTPKL